MAKRRKTETVRTRLGKDFALQPAQVDVVINDLLVNLEALNAHILAQASLERWPDVAEAGHAVESVAVNIGQHDLSRIGAGLVTAAEAGDADTVDELSERLDDWLAELFSD